MKAGVEGAELHRLRKTYADKLHEEGVSVNTIRIRLGHESLDVTLAYLKGKDAESEEARSTPTAAAWRCTHKVRTSTTGDFWVINSRSPVLIFRLVSPSYGSITCTLLTN
jgi:hypothetical protein